MRTGPATWKEYDVVRSLEDENSFGFHGKLSGISLHTFSTILLCVIIIYNIIHNNNKR